MLPKDSRLPSSEFLSRGYRTQKTPYFSLKAKPNGLLKNRIGVIINVAAVKSAARRNFWKRQVKSSIFNFQFSIFKKTGRHFDFLVIFFKKGDSLTKAEFKKELLGALASLLP
jgi:ribonuclease P protein component